MARAARRAAFALALAAFTASAAAQAPPPRYLALKGGEVAGRHGPSAEQKIDWLYRRTGLPVRVISESGGWRRVEDPGGARVWMLASDLEDRRTVYVEGGRLGSASLRREPEGGARVDAVLERGVIAALLSCRGDWRRVKVEEWTGWVEAQDLWGAEAC